MIDKTIIIKSGVDIESEAFKIYYQKLTEEGKVFDYLENAIKDKSEVLLKPFPFKDLEYGEYSIDDISFFWMDDEIIGHQVINMKKVKGTIYLGNSRKKDHIKNQLENPKYRKKITRLEFVGDKELKDTVLYQYYHERISGKLESELVIQYEKQNKVKK